jgi:hypothetical protein
LITHGVGYIALTLNGFDREWGMYEDFESWLPNSPSTSEEAGEKFRITVNKRPTNASKIPMY